MSETKVFIPKNMELPNNINYLDENTLLLEIKKCIEDLEPKIKIQPLVSIIFPTRDEGKNILASIHSLLKIGSNHSFEIIIVDDGSIDGCCDFVLKLPANKIIKVIKTKDQGSANARNIGAREAKGIFLIFCDAHLFFYENWLEKLLEPIFKNMCQATSLGIAPHTLPNNVAYGQTILQDFNLKWTDPPSMEPFETPILPGACIAMHKNTFEQIEGFENNFILWGYEDAEISIKLWLFGYTCMIQPQTKVLHVFKDVSPYGVTPQHVHYNMLRMGYLHFSEDRLERLRQNLKSRDPNNIEALEKQLLTTDILEKRARYFQKRKYDDNWFVSKFKLAI